MSYLIRPRESLASEVIRVMSEQNQRASVLLQTWKDNPRDHVHQARQAFKRIRALLRLIRPGARFVFRVENAFYRDLGRMLAFARDTEAVIDALDLVAPRVSGPLAQESLRMLKIGLQQRARRQRDCGLHDLAGRIDNACRALERADRRLQDMPLDGLRRRHLRKGVEASLEQCAAAFARVDRKPDAEDLHAWRKNVKCAYHQTRLMEQSMPLWAAGSGPALGTLAEILGQYHDLSMLDVLLRSQSDDLNLDVHLRSMRNAVQAAMSDLCADSLARGTQLFATPGPRNDELSGLKSRA